MKKKFNNKAQAIIIIFVYMGVVSLMGIFLIKYAANLNHLVVQQLNHAKAVNAAEAGVIRRLTERYNGATAGASYSFTFDGMTVAISDVAMATPNSSRIVATISNWR